MPIRTLLLCVAVILAAFRPALADPPALSYVFPAGGQRGPAVDVKVGALDLPSKAFVEVLGSGVDGGGVIRRVPTLWFEGPFLTQPDSVQVEDYPRDFASRFQIAADAPVGPRGLRIWNSEGASGSIPFLVGDLPEVVEREEEGETPPSPVTRKPRCRRACLVRPVPPAAPRPAMRLGCGGSPSLTARAPTL